MPASTDPPPRVARAIECALVFGLLPAVLAGVRASGRGVPVLLALALAALAAWLVLRRDLGFDRRELVRWEPRREALAWILARFALAAGLLAGGVLALEPQRWLELPRERPGLWALVMLLYPALSVVPQELIFRTFFFRRYAVLWGEGRGAILPSALAFAWAHVVFLSWPSIVLTALGGWILARTYERTRSLPLVALEHALYGALVFTIGLGRHFYAPP